MISPTAFKSSTTRYTRTMAIMQSIYQSARSGAFLRVAICALSYLVLIPAVCGAQSTTQDFTDPGAFTAATNNPSVIGFNGIVPAGATYQGFNPLSISGISFSAPQPGVAVDVAIATYYSQFNLPPYQADFIVDSSNPYQSNELVISFSHPTHAVGLTYGGLGFSGVGIGTITLSNGHVITQVLQTVGNLQFAGFISSEPITSISLLTSNDNWVLESLVTADIALTVTPSSVEFGSTEVNQSRSKRFVVSNVSSTSVTASLSSLGAPFSLDQNAGSFSLPPFTSQTVDVIFQPTTTGTFDDAITVTPSTGVPLTVPVSGTASPLGSVKVWISAFIPYSYFGPLSLFPESFILEAPGLTYAQSLLGIGGDGRSFVAQPGASYRTQWLEEFDASTLTPTNISGTVGTSRIVLLGTNVTVLTASPDAGGVLIDPPIQVGSLVYVHMHGGARFGFLDGISGIPAVNVDATFRIDLANRTCQLVGTYGGFPAFEAYVQGDNDAPVQLLGHDVGPVVAWPFLIQGLFQPNANTITGTAVPF